MKGSAWWTRWVAGDQVYGDSTTLRDLIAHHERRYVLTVWTPTPVWTERPQVLEPEPQERGRPRTKVRLAEGAPRVITVKEVFASWPESRWQSLTVAEGEKGLITYDWACQRIVESRNRLPGPDAWLVARRSLSDPTDIAYYLSNAPVDTPLLKLAQVASTRYTVEQCIEEAKGETGLDEYEVRYLLEVALPLPYRSPELRLAWSLWRQAKRWQARVSHSRRQANAWRLRLKPDPGIPAKVRL